MEAWKKTCVTGLSTKYRQRGECCINIVSWELLVLEHFRIPLAPGQSAHSGEISFYFLLVGRLGVGFSVGLCGEDPGGSGLVWVVGRLGFRADVSYMVKNEPLTGLVISARAWVLYVYRK